MPKQPISTWHISSGYRPLCWYWWYYWYRYITHGWYQDIYTFWHRGRYGWAPRDTWSFDLYIAGVLGAGLAYLAATTVGAPCGYPEQRPEFIDDDLSYEQWLTDITRWSVACSNYAKDDYWDLHGRNFDAWHADETARYLAFQTALKELAPWVGGLWS